MPRGVCRIRNSYMTPNEDVDETRSAPGDVCRCSLLRWRTWESVDGSVFLFPITDSFEFRSLGEAAYLDDLGQEDSGAVLSGTHSVNGPVVFEHPVQGSAGKYDYVLEGPAQPRACYGTTLHVIADPPGMFDTIDVTFTGTTKCAPRELQTDPVATCPGCCPYSPVIISERGDYRLTSVVDGVTSDIDADGVAERVSWTAPGTDLAFLALDQNRNGHIDSGAELFGDAVAANGWEALAELDTNGDA
jgi:hypothetical protein